MDDETVEYDEDDETEEEETEEEETDEEDQAGKVDVKQNANVRLNFYSFKSLAFYIVNYNYELFLDASSFVDEFI